MKLTDKGIEYLGADYAIITVSQERKLIEVREEAVRVRVVFGANGRSKLLFLLRRLG